MLEVQENPAKILIVFLQPVIELLYFRLGQEPQDAFFKLPRPFARNNFYQRNFLIHRFRDNPVEFRVNSKALVINLV